MIAGCAGIYATAKPLEMNDLQLSGLDTGESSAVFTVEEIPHRVSSSLVRCSHCLAFVRVHGALGYGVHRFGGAALGAAVGESGFVGLQFELFVADDADFDGKGHWKFYDTTPAVAGIA